MNSTEKGNVGESFVNEVSYNSFLKYWCYPSPRDEYGDKKEICDLLIIFDTRVIIISVKNYEFKENYSRYFRRTLDKAVSQIYRAERKLFSKERDVFLQHPDKSLEKFPKDKIEKVYRIIVNLGEGVKFYPFNKETKDEKYIALFDRKAFQTIVSELDTIPDFIQYLEKREQLFSDKSVIILPGDEEDFPIETTTQFFEYSKDKFNPQERQSILLSGTEHDLLAHYLKNEKDFPELIKSTDYNGMYLQLDGTWEDFISRNQVIQKKQNDKNSYFIDELVKREVLINKNPQSEEIAKALLSFDRFDRRIISNKFLQFYDTYKNNKGLNLARRYGDFDGTGVVFVFYTPQMDNLMVNTLLEITLDSFCVFTNYKSKRMILIATTTQFKQFKMGLVKDIKPFSKEKEEQIKKEVKTLGWFTNHEEIFVSEKEYPGEE